MSPLSVTSDHTTWLRGRTWRVLLYLLATVYGLCDQSLLWAQPGTWQQRNALGYAQPVVPEMTARQGATVFTIAGKAYLMGGYDNSYRSDTWEYDPVTDLWTERAAFPGAARSSAVAFVIGSKGYVCTGYSYSTSALSDVWEFDPAANAWTQKGNFPGGARLGAVAFSVAAKGYVAAGLTASNTRLGDCWEYEASTDSWTQHADFGGTARYSAVAFTIGATGYVGTGYGPGRTTDLWAFDPLANSWTQRANFGGSGRTDAAVSVVNGMAYLASGSNMAGQPVNDLWRYDPTTNSWTQRANMPLYVRRAANSFSLAGGFYMTCGEDGDFLGDLWRYDDATNAWTRKRNITGLGRYGAVAVAIRDKGYLGTGYHFESLGDWWQYDPASGAWTAKATFPSLARSGAFVFTIGSKCFIGGGIRPTGYSNNNWQLNYVNDLWMYDAVTDTWTQKAPLPGSVRSEAAAFSIGGRGYVCGGITGATYLNDTWSYDPTTDQWTQQANVPGLPRAGAITFTIGARGYVGGGLAGSQVSFQQQDLWAYDPVTDAWAACASNLLLRRGGAFAFSLGTEGYVGCGQNSSSSYDAVVIKYDPVTNSWQNNLPFFGGGARTSVRAFVANGRAFAGTGSPGNGTQANDLWELVSQVVPLTTPLKVILSGPYDQSSGLMRDDLRAAGLLPLTEPMTASGLIVSTNANAQLSAGVLTTIGNNAIVDWVLVELRSPNAPYSVLASMAALVQRDGDVVMTDGVSPITFNAVPGNFRVAVRHRNHLGVMSAAAVALSTNSSLIDFTSTTTATYGTNAQTQVGTKMVLWAGDATGNGQIKYTGSGNDRDPILTAVGGTTPNTTLSNVYDRRDTNLDGVIKYTGSGNDRDIILTNVGSTTPNNTRTQQLP